MGHGFGNFGFGNGEELAELFGITTEELREALADQTLAQVAEANGVSEDELTAHLLGQIEEAVAQKVEDGKIDQAQADEILANAAEKISESINREGPPEGGHKFGGGSRFRGHFGQDGDSSKDLPTTETSGLTF